MQVCGSMLGDLTLDQTFPRWRAGGRDPQNIRPCSQRALIRRRQLYATVNLNCQSGNSIGLKTALIMINNRREQVKL